MFLHFLNDLFYVTIEIDGHLNKLNSETVQLQYIVERNAMRKRILIVDFGALEARVIANIATPVDIHTEKAVAMFGENFTPKQRKYAKKQNYLKLYGGQPMQPSRFYRSNK